MAKFTKKQQADIAAALADVTRALDYPMSDRVAICSRSAQATTTLHFTRAPIPEVLQTADSRRLGDYALQEMAKDIGSDLCRLGEARRKLQAMLEG